MFARPTRKKRTHGSNLSSTIGDNHSNSGSLDIDAIESFDNQIENQQRDVLSPLASQTQFRSLRRAASNNALRPPITSYTNDGMMTNSPQVHFQLGQRRSISGNYTSSKNNGNINGQTLNNNRPHFPPPALPKNLAHLRSPRTRNSSLNPISKTEELTNILNRTHNSPQNLKESLNDLRVFILKYGIPDEENSFDISLSNTYRCRIWKALLGVYTISAGEYLQYIAKGPSPMFDKVKNDTFRTLATDKKFLERVQESMLVRVLNATVWRAQSSAPPGAPPTRFDYVQGMNVLVAPFLFVMPEVDAFYSSNMLLKQSCPTYVLPTLAGVHCGLKLMDKCLEVLDAELFFYLKSKGLTAEIYAFASILTLSACTPPLDELLKWWDFLLAFGVHLNVIGTIAQLMLIRQSLLTNPSPIKLLRTFPDLQSYTIIQLTRHLVKQLPQNLYEDLARHPFDNQICDKYLTLPTASELQPLSPNSNINSLIFNTPANSSPPMSSNSSQYQRSFAPPSPLSHPR